MSETKFTKGPWEAGDNRRGLFSNEVVVRPQGQFPHGAWIADCGSRSDGAARAKANGGKP